MSIDFKAAIIRKTPSCTQYFSTFATLFLIVIWRKLWPSAAFRRAIETNGLPSRIMINKAGANLAGIRRINVGLKFSRSKQRIAILRVKYLNNVVEQDHCFIKKITRPTLDFKAFHSAAATRVGIKVAQMG